MHCHHSLAQRQTVWCGGVNCCTRKCPGVADKDIVLVWSSWPARLMARLYNRQYQACQQSTCSSSPLTHCTAKSSLGTYVTSELKHPSRSPLEQFCTAISSHRAPCLRSETATTPTTPLRLGPAPQLLNMSRAGGRACTFPHGPSHPPKRGSPPPRVRLVVTDLLAVKLLAADPPT